MKRKPTVAYFSMEIAHANEMPNYAGGLGVLAADILLSAADMGTKMLGVSLLYHKDDDIEHGFDGGRYIDLTSAGTVEVEIEDRKVKVAIYVKELNGRKGHTVPILFLSTHLPENTPWDRDLTKHLYAADRYTRLGQEVVLGVGGVRALVALGHKIGIYHLNEGHAAFATLELMRIHKYDDAAVRPLVTFTTHTPIAAGHDYFEYDLAGNVLRDMMVWDIRGRAGEDRLGMTQLAMNLSKATNSVSVRHRQVCEEMFPGKTIKNVTNGIYAPRWAGEHMEALYDEYLTGWAEKPKVFQKAKQKLPSDALRAARDKEKAELVTWINFNKAFFSVTNVSNDDFLEAGALTIGFGRRTVPYKRPDLIFRNIERLAEIAGGRVQLIFANRCHPDDTYCNDLRSRLNECADTLRGKVKIVLIPDYDLHIAKRLVSGCDVWLNTPVPPLEASGTSGMKAALNGVLNLSMRDGWWIEGLEKEPMAGWGFGGERYPDNEQDSNDANALLDALEDVVGCYYERPDEWTERMKAAITLTDHFNTTRVVEEYMEQIWRAD